MTETGHRVAIVCALEALEVGDGALAVDLLLAALESDGPRLLSRALCPACGLELEWPGRVEAHLRRVHLLDTDEIAALLRSAAQPWKAAA